MEKEGDNENKEEIVGGYMDNEEQDEVKPHDEEQAAS